MATQDVGAGHALSPILFVARDVLFQTHHFCVYSKSLELRFHIWNSNCVITRPISLLGYNRKGHVATFMPPLPHTLPPSPLQSPPPPPGRPSLHCFARQYLLRWLCCLSVTHARPCIAFPSLQISHPCVFWDILSSKVVYSVSCCFFRLRKDVFSR